ncbi:MAG: type II toxin-antitoxin system VapC family toxin [Gammaproteobacteria bacterium]|nr:type II toxin-antitoxin system VapC family toxin [Gammaproteobacteria bacterium]
MITAVDTNVLLDVFRNDPRFCTQSAALLRRCLGEGTLVACEVVWAETSAAFSDQAAFHMAMETLGVAYTTLNQQSAERAAAAWRRYRARGGKRSRVLADFLIGAHALHQADRILTRDRGFYRPYFKGLQLLDPATK